MIDWKKYPEAKSSVITFLDSDSGYVAHENMDRPTQTKTVADAVEHYNGEFPEGQDISGIAYSNEKITPYYSGSPIAKGTNSPCSYIICTREQFEAYVEEQEGENWTHTHGGGIKCKVIAVDGEHSWVLNELGNKVTEYTSSLKPIKPTISEDAVSKLRDYANWTAGQESGYVSELIEEFIATHEII